MTAINKQLIDDCLFYIRTTDYVSMAELENWLAGRGVNVAGEHSLEIAPNTVLWAGVSEVFCDILDQLRPYLDLVPASSLLVYIADGKFLSLPIAKRPPKGGYRKRHWLPVTLRTKQRATPGEIRQALPGCRHGTGLPVTAIAELLGDQAAAGLARLALQLATAPPTPAEPTAAVCPTCGQRRPVPAAVFSAPDRSAQ
jgi:hypothetical protein